MKKFIQILLIILLATNFCKVQRWDNVGGGVGQSINGVSLFVETMGEFKNELYISGLFNMAGGKKTSPNIVK